MKKTILTVFTAFVFSALTLVSQTHAAKMSLSPATADLKAGCGNSVSILINTEGADSDAADAFLKYDPNQIEITGIGNGNVYRSYPGKVFGNGTIRLTAFNDTGSFNGRGLLATLNFKSKPGVTAANIDFNFSPGSSTDSNVASMEAVDLLDGAFGGKYTFTQSTGPCTSDNSPPFLDKASPEPGAVNVAPDAIVTFTLKDTGSGVDINTATVDINGVVYSKSGANTFTYEKTKEGYDITIRPVTNFAANVPVLVTVKSMDLDGNAMQDVTYGFNQTTPVAGCPSSPALKPAAPAAPAPIVIVSYWLWFIITFILLLVSLGLNYYLYRNTNKNHHRGKAGLINHFIHHE